MIHLWVNSPSFPAGRTCLNLRKGWTLGWNHKKWRLPSWCVCVYIIWLYIYINIYVYTLCRSICFFRCIFWDCVYIVHVIYIFYTYIYICRDVFALQDILWLFMDHMTTDQIASPRDWKTAGWVCLLKPISSTLPHSIRMAYLSWFTLKINQVEVNLPYMDGMGPVT